MKVARNTTHNLRHDWLSISDEKGRVIVSIMANRSDLFVDIELDGVRDFEHIKPRELATALARMLKERSK